jgi:hypothetical protein
VESWLSEVTHDDQRRIEMLRVSMVNCRLLDFGCGAAGFLCKAQSIAAEVVGVEPERCVCDYWGVKIKLLSIVWKMQGRGAI